MYSQISGDLDFDLGKESNISPKNKKWHVEKCQKEKWLGKVLGPIEDKVKSYHWSKNKEEQTMQVQKIKEWNYKTEKYKQGQPITEGKMYRNKNIKRDYLDKKESTK